MRYVTKYSTIVAKCYHAVVYSELDIGSSEVVDSVDLLHNSSAYDNGQSSDIFRPI